MRKFYHNKLWREKLIQKRQEDGAIIHFIPLSHAQYSEELGIKLLEEANEVYAADTHQKMVDEIVDVLEVIDCIIDFHGISKDEITKHKDAKLLEFGSYTDYRLVDYVEYRQGSKEEKFCLDNPDEYPELNDDETGSSINNSCCKS